MSRHEAPSAPDPLARRWPWLIRSFQWYGRRFVRRSFHAVRLARQGAKLELPDGPLILALSHPSWWDPMMGVVLSPLLGDRVHVVPIEDKALQHYRFFERLGFFGIEPGTRAGYERLIQVADGVLGRRDVAFWITPQGRFTDVRQRPLGLRPGVGHLAQRMTGGTILPVALEYCFWTERLPEALVHFGEPIGVADGGSRSVEAWTELVTVGLTRAQDELARAAVERNPDAFHSLLSGGSGVSWIYDAWRRLAAWVRGERFELEHAAVSTRTAAVPLEER